MNLPNSLFLQSLSLKNFATFETQNITFKPGFNAITGETGSGKSLILDALRMILGERSDRKLVRKGSEFAHIEAVFSCQDQQIQIFLQEQGYPLEDQSITIKRLLYANGSSKTYFNFSLCNLSFLKEFSRRSIDLVGQFENQKLMDDYYQLSLIDQFADLNSEKQKFLTALKNYNSSLDELKILKKNSSEKEQKLDFLNFQLKELEKLNPSEEEEKTLLQQQDFLANKEKRQALSQAVLEKLSSPEQKIDAASLTSSCLDLVQKNSDLFSPDLTQHLVSALNSLEEASFLVNGDLNLEEEETSLDFVMERLHQYQKLKRKYHKETDELIAFFNDLKQEKAELESLDDSLAVLSQQVLDTQKKAFDLALKLHNRRKKAAEKLSQELTASLQYLNMQGASTRFELEKKKELGPTGITDLRFLAETNPGEGFHRVQDIASGGELSRILLALRQVLSSKDSISIFLFDEIDSGIGGKTALRIGETLQKTSQDSQVLAITHLPQIAHYADKLIVVSKETQHQRTVSLAQEFSSKKAQQQEIEKMIPLQ